MNIKARDGDGGVAGKGGVMPRRAAKLEYRKQLMIRLVTGDGARLLERRSSKEAAGAVKDEEVEAGGGSRLLNDFLCADLPRHIDRLGRNLLSYPHAFQLW
jgi:hypothetical protein